MADRINIDQGRVEEKAGQIRGAAAYLVNVPLTPQDNKTTLPANEKGRRHTEGPRSGLPLLGVC